MKKLFLTLLCAMIATVAGAQSIVNGGFESGNMDGWVIWKSMNKVSIASDGAYKGKYAALVEGGFEQTLSLTKGKYTLTAYTKCLAGDRATITIREKEEDSYKYVETQSAAVPSETGSYQKIVINFKLTKDNKIKILASAPNKNKFLIDEIVLVAK